MVKVGQRKGGKIMYVDVTPYYENTRQQAYYNNTTNELRFYEIAPVDGYVLHDQTLDTPEFDEELMEETGNILPGYTPGSITVPHNYNFEANPRQIYAVLRTTVPENQIFGVDDKEHEVM